MGTIPEELNAERKEILTKVPNEEKRSDEGVVHHVRGESLHVRNVTLDEYNRILYDRDEVDIVPLWFILCESDYFIGVSKGHENANPRVGRFA